MSREMSRDELIQNLAETVAGLQVPISLNMSLGSAEKPVRNIMGLMFGWNSAEEFVAKFREILDEGV